MSTNNIQQKIIQEIWRGSNPLSSFPKQLFEVDMQGWNSGHPFLGEEIALNRPAIIVEVGVWKGGSTISMAKKLKELQIDGVVIAVDTWLGAWDHWIKDEWFDSLSFEHGYPRLFYKFCANVIAAGVQDYVVPLPLDSVNAANLLSRLDITPDIIHIDAGHDFDAVTSDLSHWWSLLRTGGAFIGDDYYGDGITWQEVKRAIDVFLSAQRHSDFRYDEGKCRATKVA